MKNLFQKTGFVLTMALLSACDENMPGEGDASTPESCVLYVNPDAEVDAGTGESEASPFSSMDVVMSKAAALKSRCGDAAEIRIADGALSNEQSVMAKEALKSAGVKVGRYSKDNSKENRSSNSSPNIQDRRLRFGSKAGIDLSRKLPGIHDLEDIQDLTARKEGSPWWEESGTSNNIFYTTGNVSIGMDPLTTVELAVKGPKLDAKAAGQGTFEVTDESGSIILMDGNEIDGNGGLYFNDKTKKDITMVRYGGNVGIGMDPETGDESTRMTVKGTNLSSSGASGTLQIMDSAGSSTFLVMDGNEIDGSNGLYLNHKFNKEVFIAGNNSKDDKGKYLNSNYVYMVRNDGRVGIGNLSKSQVTHKLTVDGGIKAEEIVVDAVGADFVFEDDYDLMSLDEVESFVEENNHLPGVESAESMQQNGLEMGEFQIKLLQKIEELTLYAIEQKNQIKKLEAALNEVGIPMPKEVR